MTKTLKLTQKQVAMVDNIDFEYLNQYNWSAAYNNHIKGFYAVRCKYIGMINGKKKNKMTRMHRLIMEKTLGRELKESEIVDHINHDPLDNRRKNLRVVSQRQNHQNLKSNQTSKYPGVFWEKNVKKWRAKIEIEGKQKHLGLFTNEREAAKAYEQACRELVGEELVCKNGDD